MTTFTLIYIILIFSTLLIVPIINVLSDMKKSKKNVVNLLWIDDYRNPFSDKWMSWIYNKFGEIDIYNNKINYNIIWVKNYYEFKSYIDNFGLPNIVCFDHDLGECGENEHNGYTCAKYIAQYCMNHNCKYPKYDIQSANIVGAQNIKSYITNFNKHWK